MVGFHTNGWRNAMLGRAVARQWAVAVTAGCAVVSTACLEPNGVVGVDDALGSEPDVVDGVFSMVRIRRRRAYTFLNLVQAAIASQLIRVLRNTMM